MTIRLATAADAAEIAGIYAPFVAGTAISFETEPPDAAEMCSRIEDTLAFAPWLVFEENGRILGYTYACQHRSRAAYRWSVDVSVYVRPDAQRRGIARRLYERLFAASEKLGYVTAFAGITLPNAASVGFHESMGFSPVGTYRNVGYKFGAWRDTGWFQKPLGEPPDCPAEPSKNVVASMD